MRGRIAGVVVGGVALASLAMTGCGRTGQADVADNGSPSSGPPAPPSSAPGTTSTTKATPTTKVKATPQCAAVSRFKLAQLGASMAPKDKQQQLIDVMNTQSNELRTQLPQFGDAVNQQVLAVRKTIAGTITEDDKRNDRVAQDQIGTWFKDNCIESATGGAAPTTAPAAPTTTAKPGASTTTAKPAAPSTTAKR